MLCATTATPSPKTLDFSSSIGSHFFSLRSMDRLHKVSSLRSMDCLAIEVTTQILSTLPVRSVFRCRSVCKTWRKIIDDPQFADSHLSRSIEAADNNTKSTSFLFLPADCCAVYLVEQDSEERFKSTRIDFSGLLPISSYDKLSVNGLFCFSSGPSFLEATNASHTYICNPFTRKSVKLPNFMPRDLANMRLAFGFGFDPSRKEFKVVHIFYGTTGDLRTEAQVFTLGSNSWKKLKNVPDVLVDKDSIAVNGSLHWLPIIYTNNPLLSYDLASENFGFIGLPDFRDSGKKLFLINLDGCLSVVDHYKKRIEIWVMKEYGVRESWTKIIIASRYVVDGVRVINIQPISFWKDGEILLLCNSTILVSYNVGSGRYTPLCIDGLPQNDANRRNDLYNNEVHPYAGNLISLQPAE